MEVIYAAMVNPGSPPPLKVEDTQADVESGTLHNMEIKAHKINSTEMSTKMMHEQDMEMVVKSKVMNYFGGRAIDSSSDTHQQNGDVGPRSTSASPAITTQTPSNDIDIEESIIKEHVQAELKKRENETEKENDAAEKPMENQSSNKAYGRMRREIDRLREELELVQVRGERNNNAKYETRDEITTPRERVDETLRDREREMVGERTMSTVTFAATERDERQAAMGMDASPHRNTGDAISVATRDSGASVDTPGRSIRREDVKNVFRGSTTTGTVSTEQIVRIRKIHDKISQGVNWDFNYSVLLMVASIVAGIGLAIDSATTVISSMLLSPIMGPVLGMAYGVIIWDIDLIKRSMRNEVLSIIVCLVLGLLVGVSCAYTPMAKEWPTSEMLSRGTPTNLYAGIAIAFFSGLGVALSVIDDQTSSLVGVAISASLLPPAVNCGMLWMMAIVNDDYWVEYKLVWNDKTLKMTHEGEYHYYHNLGLISLSLTVANVIMVAVGACLMFRLKEVLPVTKKVFWDDLKAARRIYQGRATDEATGEELGRTMVDRKRRQEKAAKEKTRVSFDVESQR